jgi:putative transposase
VNRRRAYRLYCEERLAVRQRKRRRPGGVRVPIVAPDRLNRCWAIDFVADNLATARRFRAYRLADACSKVSPAIRLTSRSPVPASCGSWTRSQ